MARKFFYICGGMLMLALSYYFGAQNATAQNSQTIAGFSGTGGHCSGVFYVMTPNGDIYGSAMAAGPCGSGQTTPDYIGNFWSGSPTHTQQESWGQLKSRYAPNRGTARPGADRR